MATEDELLSLADELDSYAETAKEFDVVKRALTLKRVADDVGKAFGGSWHGYHANVYYEELKSPPPGARFSQEWGLMGISRTNLGSRGSWTEYDPHQLKAYIRQHAGQPDNEVQDNFLGGIAKTINEYRGEILSILTTALETVADTYLKGLRDNIEGILIYIAI